MIDAVSEFLAEGFEKDLYQAALENLSNEASKLRLNNFAYAMRELVRHVLNRLSPDNSVRQCVWYKNETQKPDAVTRRQRAYFAVQGGLPDDYIKSTLDIDANGIHKSLIKAIDNLSKFTHIEPHTFGLDATEVLSYVTHTLDAVSNLFNTMRECRGRIVEKLQEHIDDSVVDEALRETINAIDAIASHHCIEAVYTETVTVTAIDHRRIHFVATGTISCDLQWGSNSDVRRDEGAVMSDSYPFTCHLSSPVDDPTNIEGHEDGIIVDTSAWWDGYHDEDS